MLRQAFAQRVRNAASNPAIILPAFAPPGDVEAGQVRARFAAAKRSSSAADD